METDKRSRSIGPWTYDYRKEHTVFSHHIARDILRERQREIERRLRHRFDREPQRHRRSVRQRVGRGLIQIGLALAADGGRARRLDFRARRLAFRARGLAPEPSGSPHDLSARR